MDYYEKYAIEAQKAHRQAWQNWREADTPEKREFYLDSIEATFKTMRLAETTALKAKGFK